MDNFIAIGADEMAALPPIQDTVKCWVCGGEHEVKKTYGTDSKGNTTDFYISTFKCGEKSYMCGLASKEWRPEGM